MWGGTHLLSDRRSCRPDWSTKKALEKMGSRKKKGTCRKQREGNRHLRGQGGNNSDKLEQSRIAETAFISLPKTRRGERGDKGIVRYAEVAIWSGRKVEIVEQGSANLQDVYLGWGERAAFERMGDQGFSRSSMEANI